MPSPLLIVKNCPHEGPGIFENVLKQEKIPYEIIDLDAGDCWPELKEYSALLVMGGPESANDRTDKMREEIMQLQKALRLEIPCLGVCLGLQALVKASEGHVRKNIIKEIGCKDRERSAFCITLTEAGIADPLFAMCKPELPIFQLHGETVDITPTMTVLATGKWCVNQAIRIGKNAYGIQGHWEITKESLKEWIEKDVDLRAIDQERLLADWNELQILYGDCGRKIFRNFLSFAGLIAA